jgi:hypothetical protein
MLDKVTRFSIARPRALALTFKLFGAMTVLVVATLGTATSSQAVPLMWTLHAENFNIDGSPATMSGSFIYDADVNLFSNAAITISGSTAPAANGVYDNFDVGFATAIYLWNDVNNNGSIDYGFSDSVNPDWGLGLAFQGYLTNGGGTVDVRAYGISIGLCAANYSGSGGAACATSGRGGSGDPSGYVTASAVVPSAVPLPAALPLFATGLGALGLLGWHRKRKKTAAIAA